MRVSKKGLISKCIKLYTKTLNKNSKFYNTDLLNFKNNIREASLDRVKSIFNNLSYMQSKQSDIDFDRETDKLDKAGMFDIRKLKPSNSLD